MPLRLQTLRGLIKVKFLNASRILNLTHVQSLQCEKLLSFVELLDVVHVILRDISKCQVSTLHCICNAQTGQCWFNFPLNLTAGLSLEMLYFLPYNIFTRDNKSHHICKSPNDFSCYTKNMKRVTTSQILVLVTWTTASVYKPFKIHNIFSNWAQPFLNSSHSKYHFLFYWVNPSAVATIYT